MRLGTTKSRAPSGVDLMVRRFDVDEAARCRGTSASQCPRGDAGRGCFEPACDASPNTGTASANRPHRRSRPRSERGRLRGVEHLKSRYVDFDVARWHTAVFGFTLPHGTFHLDDKLATELAGLRAELRVGVHAEGQLGQAVAVPKVHKRHPAEVAGSLHPSAERDVGAGMVEAEFSASVRSMHGTPKLPRPGLVPMMPRRVAFEHESQFRHTPVVGLSILVDERQWAHSTT